MQTKKKNSLTLILDHCYAHFFHRARELSQVLRHFCGAFHSTTLQLLHMFQTYIVIFTSTVMLFICRQPELHICTDTVLNKCVFLLIP